MDADRLGHLLDRYVDGDLPPEEKLELERMLLSSPEARAVFWKRARFHALLRRYGEETWGQSAAAAPEVAKGVRFPRARLAWLALAAGVVIAGMTLAWRPWPAASEPMTNGVAVLGPSVDAVWAEGVKRATGDVLPPGWLRLKSGLAQVEFVSGARVILEGPAELQLTGALAAFCPSGRLSAEVPPQAAGFRLVTPHATFVELSTELGMQVRADGATDVHVFRGRVEVHRGEEMQPLAEGENTRVTADGSLAKLAGEAPQFPSSEELAALAADGFRARNERWRIASHEIAAMPGLVLFFDFQSGRRWSRTLQNVCADPARGTDGSIVGCRWGEGRWPGRSALEFRGVTDRVRVSAPGDFSSFTFAAWVCVDSLDHNYNSLLMTDGWQPGDVHWQISRSGEIVLGVNGSKNYGTRTVFPPERLAQWSHLAVTFDRAAGRVTHFVDGQPVNEEPIKAGNPPVAQLGQAELGNWNQRSSRDSQPIRNFSGRMDEVLVFRRALGAAEVLALYRSGHGS